MAQFSLRNTVQCDSTLLASIKTGRFVTGCQYSSQMRAVSRNQLMLDVLWCGDDRENVTQSVTLSKLTGTIGLILFWTEILLVGHTHLFVFPRGGIMAEIHRSDILERIVRQHSCAIDDAFIVMQDNALSHAAQVYMPFMGDTTCIRVINWPAMYPYINPTERTWGILSRRFRQRPHHPDSVHNLIDALVQALQAIPIKGIMMTTRCCRDKGGQASYW